MKLTAIPRITLGLVSLSVGLLIAFDLILHLFPSEADTTREVRTRLVNSLAIQAAALMQARDMRSVDRTLAAMQARDPEIVSIGLRRADGSLVSHAGDHAPGWVAPANDKSTLNEMVVGIVADQQRWGALEVAFRPIHQRAIGDWLFSGPTKLLVLFSCTAGLLFFVYLRRVLQHLDPSAAVPERVRGAFDALTEGVLIVDKDEHILLANQSFQALAPDAQRAELLGKRASSLTWLSPVRGNAPVDATPWLTTMRTRTPTHGMAFEVERAGASNAKVVINCAPLLDEQQSVRGCLITLDDVTALEQTNEQLLEVLADLVTSKEQLERKNAELQYLADKDPLTGCLNRRSFFVGMQQMFAKASKDKTTLVCIMADIDHFKSINDRYGHGVGDEAIKCFADILRSSVREGDLVGRFGGEEFCIVAPGMQGQRAMQLAETMRQRLAAERGVGQAAGHSVTMTASFGFATTLQGAKSVSELIDQADQAMYEAKQGGRNRVIAFDPIGQTEDHVAAEVAS